MKILIISLCILFITILITIHFYRPSFGHDFSLSEGFFNGEWYKNKIIDRTKDNYLDGIDVIYWINLDRSHKRREHMQQILNDPVFDNIDKNRITASDGKNDPNIMDNFILEKKSSIKITEYATLLSHLNAIREFSTSNHEIGLIFEDDITLDLKSHWKKSVKEIIENAPSDWEIIQLYYIIDNHFKIPENEYTFVNNNNFIVLNNNIIHHERVVVSSYSTAAYIINKKAALRFINNYYKNNKYMLKNYLHVADFYILKHFKTYTYKFPMFSTVDDISTIDPTHIDQNNKSKKYILKTLFNIDI